MTSNGKRLLQLLIERGPSIVDELAAATGDIHDHLYDDIQKLAVRGLIVRTGERRRTRRGINAAVWGAAINRKVVSQ